MECETKIEVTLVSALIAARPPSTVECELEKSENNTNHECKSNNLGIMKFLRAFTVRDGQRALICVVFF